MTTMSQIPRLGLVALLGLATGAQAQLSSAGNPANGKRIYMTVGCYACHGTTGSGGGSAGPPLRLVLPSFEAFRGQLRRPADKMPPYGEALLSDQSIRDITAYLRTIPKGKEVDQIPLLHR
jgi:mono/diheme cytochrome c family protein